MSVWALASRMLFRTLGIVAIAIFTANLVSLADTLSERDRSAGTSHLEKTRDAVLGAVKGLSAEQAKFKQAQERWSVAQVVEHLAVTESFLFDIISGQVMQAPPGDPKRNLAEMDQQVLTVIADRATRVNASAEVSPYGKLTLQEATDQFRKSRERTLQFLRNTPDLRNHVMDSPIGPMDAYQWLLFISAHTDRHLKQIEEVKADARFPAR